MEIDGTLLETLETAWLGPGPKDAPTLVFLHDGLGCIGTWRDFPSEVVTSTGCGALVYSRRGYGASAPVTLPRPLRYMHDEALETLPKLLDAFAIERAVLVGHSDGASIALIYAGAYPNDARIAGLALEAPHVFVEDLSIAGITDARHAFEGGDLRERLTKYHGANTDGAFWGWNRAWLDPGFRAWNIEAYLPPIRVPVLAMQGADDEFGTLAQLDAIARGVAGPFARHVFDASGHTPHRTQAAATRDLIASFAATAFARA